ncbi:MAG TPA: M64 family metallopeptidase [Clostridia bacterium]|nr:M64 family metallopeptidase [Clostridia bacterium]
MRLKSLALLLALVAIPYMAALAEAPATFRLDYFHTGNATQELFSVDRTVMEPLAWPGNPQKSIDDTNRGVYFYEVRDAASNRVLYSRGFSSIFGEWKTTDEAKTANRTFHESVRFPAPSAPVRVVFKKRDAQNKFQEIWSTIVDPADKYIDKSKPTPARVIEIEKHGDPSMKVDLLLLGEGYAAAESDKCDKDVRRLANGIFGFSPFKERRADFNVWAICAPSPESGVSHPSAGIHRSTLFGSTFDVFGTERYALSFDNRAIRTTASFAPYDVLGIVMNSKEYGNGGIFGAYASVSIDHPSGVPVFVHEFGHHFGDLGDEYYFNANVAYGATNSKVEPWEPNITALLDPKLLKWKSLVASGTPLPTPWPKDTYEASISEPQKKAKKMRAEGRPETEITAMLREARKTQEQSLSEGPYAGKVGAFEGARYEPKGYYRPQQRCIMISGPTFCAVCQHAIEEIIDLYSRP